jgi:hypothetical protein
MVFKYLASNVKYGRGIVTTPQSMTTTVNKQKDIYYCIFCSKQIELLVKNERKIYLRKKL